MPERPLEAYIKRVKQNEADSWETVWDSLQWDFKRDLKPLLDNLGKWHADSRHANILG